MELTKEGLAFANALQAGATPEQARSAVLNSSPAPATPSTTQRLPGNSYVNNGKVVVIGSPEDLAIRHGYRGPTTPGSQRLSQNNPYNTSAPGSMFEADKQKAVEDAQKALTNYEKAAKIGNDAALSNYLAYIGMGMSSAPTYTTGANPVYQYGAAIEENNKKIAEAEKIIAQSQAALQNPYLGDNKMALPDVKFGLEKTGDIVKGAGNSAADGLGNALVTFVDAYGNAQAKNFGAEDALMAKAAGIDPLEQLQRNADAYNSSETKEAMQNQYAALDALQASGEQDIAQSKIGLGQFGQTIVDLGVGATQLAGDAVLAAINPALAIASLAGRVFGSSAAEARQAGADLEEQFMYGGASAAVAVTIGKAIDGMAGVLGKGWGDDMLKAFVNKLSQTPKGRAVATFVARVLGEGVEEFAEGALNPVIKAIYDDGKELERTSIFGGEDRAEALIDNFYSVIIGMALSAGTQPVAAIKGDYSNLLPERELDTSDAPAVSQLATSDKPTTNNVQPQPATQIVNTLLSTGRINNTDAAAIASNPIALQAFSNITGTTITPAGKTTNEVRSEIQKAARDYAYRHKQALNAVASSESALAKQSAIDNARDNTIAEAVTPRSQASYIRGALQNGTTAVEAKTIYDNPVLRQLWEAASGRTLPESRNKAIDAIMTSRQVTDASILPVLRALEARLNAEPAASAQNFAQNTQASSGNIQTPPTPTNASTGDSGVLNNGSQQSGVDMLVEMATGNKNTAPDGAESTAVNTDPTQQPPTNVNPPRGDSNTVPTQSRFLENSLTNEERTIDGLTEADFVHQQRHDTTVNAEAAQRIATDGVTKTGDMLMAKAADQWNDTDVVTAQKVISQELESARAANTPEEAAAIYARVAQLSKAYRNAGSETARSLRRMGGYGNTADGIIAFAAETLYDKATPLRKSFTDKKRAEVMARVTDFANRYDNLDKNNIDSLISFVREVSDYRGTTGPKSGKEIQWAIEQAKSFPDAAQFFSDVLATQIKSVPGDYIESSRREKLESYRFTAMLSKLATIARNLVSNGVLDSMEMFSNNISVPLDVLLSTVTGTRSTTFEGGALTSKAKRKGASEGFIRSLIQVGLDADIDNAPTKYDQKAGRTFKMTGNAFERFLSSWEKWEGYALKSTDEAAKGGIRAEKERGLNRLADAGKIGVDAISGIAENAALERTLQNDSRVAKAAVGARDALSELADVLGTAAMPFARVPANAVSMSAAYTPGAGIISTAKNIYDVFSAVKAGTLTADQQAKAVQSAGRTITGAGMVFASALLALKGIIKSVDDEGKDKAAVEKAAGQSGTQINLSALGRMLSGGSTEWQKDDKLLNIGFLQPINANLMMGELLAEAYAEDKNVSLSDVAEANAEALVDSLLEFPAVSQIKNMVNNYKYPDGENVLQKAGDAALGFVGDYAGSYVPNVFRGIAAGTDPYVRDVYSADGPIEQAWDSAKAGIPILGLRQTLPVGNDPWGQPKVQAADAFTNFLNQNILPGAVNTYSPNASMAELAALEEAGAGSLYPDRSAPNSIKVGGENKELSYEEKQQFIQTAGSEVNRLYQEVINSSLYAELDTESKAKLLDEMRSLAEDKATRQFVSAKGGEYSSKWDSLLYGEDKPGEDKDLKAIAEADIPSYLVFKSSMNDATKNGNMDVIDSLISEFASLPNTVQEFAKAKVDGVSALLEAADYAQAADLIPSAEHYYAIKEAQDVAWKEADIENANGKTGFAGFANADIPLEYKDAVAPMYLGESQHALYSGLRNVNSEIQPIDVYSLFYAADVPSKEKKAKGETDGDGKLAQKELGPLLLKLEAEGKISDPNAAYVWQYFQENVTNFGSTSWSAWKNKNR